MGKNSTIIIIGGGPAGLMAAEVLAGAGHQVHVYDRKPSVGRKFLMAGRGGLNLTHSEDLPKFLTRYGAAKGALVPLIDDFTPQDLRDWCEGLGQKTFVGSSGRVFPESFKASPLLRAWLGRLGEFGVTFHMQRRWTGWNENGHLVFETPDGAMEVVEAGATLLALGGASWPALGSNGDWADVLMQKSVAVSPLRPANCGFVCAWSDIFKDKFAGQPLKSIRLRHGAEDVQGDLMLTRNGIEGGAVYALSSSIRTDIEHNGVADITIDLRPQISGTDLQKKLESARGRQTFSTYLQKTLSLSPAAINLLREADLKVQDYPADRLAALIKAVPLKATATFPIERAISTAGGIEFLALDSQLMIKSLPGVFAAGEMLDWEAPTGGYLLQASFATGRAAAKGIMRWLENQPG